MKNNLLRALGAFALCSVASVMPAQTDPAQFRFPPADLMNIGVYYYPEAWREPYLARRRACGFGLYKTLGIGRDDKDAMKAQHGHNWTFFGAPVGLMFSIEADMEKGSWLDLGMFVQSVMIAARAEGLATCPQAAFAYQPMTVKRIAGIPDHHTMVCGMALGFEDASHPVNSFVTAREPLATFVTWVD